MTPEQKLRAAMRIYWSARAIKAAALRAEHPEWSDEALARAVRDAFLFRHGCLFSLFTTRLEAMPEYVIVRKLEYFREGQSHKHVDDIRHMLDHLGDRLVSVTLDQMIAERGLGVEWAIIRARS